MPLFLVRRHLQKLFLLLLLFTTIPPSAKAATGDDLVVKNKHIVVIGSSVAAGYGASSYGRSWVGLLTKALYTQGWRVSNRSIPGNNTTSVLERLQRDALSLKPDIVVIALGFHNEGLTNSSEPDKVFDRATANVLTMVKLIRAAGALPIIAGVYPNNHWDDRERAYLFKFYEWAEAQHLPIMNFLAKTEDGHGRWKEGFFADNTHPNDVGHRAMFESISLGLFDSVLKPDPVH